jgi:GNAT superfamily N-acetyltransferase
MEIRSLDLSCPGETQAWYRALSDAQSAGLVAPVVIQREAVLTSLRSNSSNPSSDRRAYGAWHEAECVGAALLDLPRRDNAHLAHLELGVPPRARHRGVGRALFAYLSDVARQEGRTVLGTKADAAGPGLDALAASPGGRFALACGFQPRHSELRLLLDVPVPQDRLLALERTAAQRAGPAQIAGWIGLPPADVLDQLAHLYTLTDADVPSGELSRAPVSYDAARVLRLLERLIEQGYQLVATLISDHGGEPAGQTMMLVMGGGGREVVQDSTFVLRPYRGRGLGTLAKIANLRLLARHFPQARHVHTWTAELNDAMHTVNGRLGFRPMETTHELELELRPER